jgi:phage-related protein
LTGLAGAGIACAKAAAVAEASQKNLDDQIQRTTGTNAAGIQMANDWVAAYSKQVAVSKSELQPALAQLVRSTGDLQHAQELLTLSTDISAATGQNLGTVAAAVGKAYNGTYGSLKRLVPSISDAAVKSKNWAEVQKELNKQVGGAAQEEAKTTEGQYRALTLQMKGLQVTIGQALLPVFAEMVQIMIPLVALGKAHTNVILALAGVVAGLSVAILAANAALKVYRLGLLLTQGAMKLLGIWTEQSTAMTIRQRVATIAAAVAQKVVRAATIAYTAAQWLLNVALSANPIGLVVVALAALAVGLVLAWRHSQTFRNIVTDAFDAVKKYGWLMLGPLAPFAAALVLAWQHSQTFQNIVTGAFNAVRDAIQQVIDLIGHIHFPSKPSWLPLSMPTGAGYWAPQPAVSGFAASSAGGLTVQVTVTGAIDPEATAIQIRRILDSYDRRRGRRPLGGQ